MARESWSVRCNQGQLAAKGYAAVTVATALKCEDGLN